MVTAGYGVEATWEGIFNIPAAEVDATRFAHLNVHIGRRFNFYIMGDSETDTADTKLTGMLAAETHQLIFELYLRAKAAAVTNPWDFMVVELGLIDFKDRFKNLIKQALAIKEGGMELVTRSLPRTTDSNVIP